LKTLKPKSLYIKTEKLIKKLNLKNQRVGKLGRIKINKKIYKKIWWKNEEYLKEEDILGCLKLLNTSKKRFA
jgi:hypothetical protein